MDQLLIYTNHAFWVLLPLNYDISGSTSGSIYNIIYWQLYPGVIVPGKRKGSAGQMKLQ